MKTGKLLILATAVSAIVVCSLFWIMRLERPLKADDFSDLRVERKALPDEKNFRVVLDEAAGLLPERVNAARWHLVAQTLRCEWDADAVTNVLAQSKAARARVKSGLSQCEGYSSLEQVKMPHGYIGSVCDNSDRNNALAWAMRVAFEHALQAGEAEQAYGLVCDMFRATSLMLASPSGLADLGHLSAWCASGVLCCEKLAHHAACRDEWLADMQARMPKRSAIVEAGTEALRSEFGRLSPYARRYSTWDQFYFPSCNELVLRMNKRYWFFMDLTFRPEQTRRLLADSFRNAIATVQSGRVGVPLDEKSVFKSTSAWASLRPNAGGRLMNEHIAFFNVSFVRRLKRLEAREECVRAALACERFRRTTGAYPETLKGLVPDYLEEPPHDPYSGEPLRYSREREIVWSVGENLRDDGGTTRAADGRPGTLNKNDESASLDMVKPVSSAGYEAAKADYRKDWKERLRRK